MEFELYLNLEWGWGVLVKYTNFIDPPQVQGSWKV